MIKTSGPGPGLVGPCGAKDGPGYEFDAGPWHRGPAGPHGRGPEDEDVEA